MIRTSPDGRRAVAILLAVAVLPFLTPRAAARTSLDLFAGAIPNTAGDPATLSVTSALAVKSKTSSATGLFGVIGYNGTVSLTTAVLNTVSEGLVGTVNVLSLFGNAGAATFQFATPANYVPANGLGVTFTSSLPASALGTAFTFTGAGINQVVPEPHMVVATLLGMGGLAVLRIRRRSAVV